MNKKDKNEVSAEQAIINEIAHQVMLSERAAEARANALASIKDVIDENEDRFLDGASFSFVEGDKNYTGKLVLKNTRKWQTTGVVVEKITNGR